MCVCVASSDWGPRSVLVVSRVAALAQFCCSFCARSLWSAVWLFSAWAGLWFVFAALFPLSGSVLCFALPRLAVRFLCFRFVCCLSGVLACWGGVCRLGVELTCSSLDWIVALFGSLDWRS